MPLANADLRPLNRLSHAKPGARRGLKPPKSFSAINRNPQSDRLLEHGDFGLGTFADLDGEMVVLDGRVYQVLGTGRVSEASPDAGAPFAVVTRFSPQTEVDTEPVASFKDLEARCDKYRYSGNNIFYAVRLDGQFTRVRTRAVKPPQPGDGLVDAAKAQSEFTFSGIDGTLVGLWSPDFSSAFSVSGYHFHFLSKDRQHGGHLLDVEAGPLRLKVEALTDFHLALPESEAFLKAILARTPLSNSPMPNKLTRRSTMNENRSKTTRSRSARNWSFAPSKHAV